MNKPLLSILKSLLKEGIYSSVIKNISYDLQHNEILGIVESGSGKSVSSLAIMDCCLRRFRKFQTVLLILILKA
jgi:peptide/nickel transport system ATP-binding protein